MHAMRETTAPSSTRGRQIFRFDTFGDEAFWGDTLKLHQAIAGARERRRRPRRQPEDGARGRAEGRRRRAARGRRRPRSRPGTVDLDDPATTLALLKLNAVVGVTGFFDTQRRAARRSASVRALPLDGRRLVRSRHRQAARRLAEPRSERRRDRRAGARSVSRSPTCCGVDEATVRDGARRLGPGQVRRRARPRRQGVPARRQDARRR